MATNLYRGSVCHRLVRVDAFVQLLAIEEVLEQLLHLRDASRTAHEDHVVHLLDPIISDHAW